MAETDAAIVNSGDTYSKEYVEKLKSDLQAKTEEGAMLRAYKVNHETKTRDLVSKLQPDVASFVDSVLTEHTDYAPEMQSMKEWADNCHQSTAIDTVLPIARLMSCASATMKRTREEASVASENSATLSNTLKELEQVKASDASKAQRISELQQLCDDRQAAAEKMQDELARAGVLKERFDFSKISAREAKTEPAAVANVLSTTTVNASKLPVEDMLFTYVNKSSPGSGSSRIRQSGTSHAHLGVIGNTAEQELSAVLRGY